MNTRIPAAKWDTVQTALQTAFHTTTVDSIELLAGRLSSALVYKIVIAGKAYVLRLHDANGRRAETSRHRH